MTEQHELLADLIHEVNRILAENMREVLQGHGIPFASMLVMGQLKHEQGLTVSELARRTGMAKSHVSTTVEELARRGWLEKRADPADQRLVRTHVTPAAHETFKEIQASVRQWLGGLVADLPERQTAELIDGLQAFRELLRGKGKGQQQ